MKTLNHFYNEERVQKEAELVKGFNDNTIREYKMGYLYEGVAPCEINERYNDKISFFVNDDGRLIEVESSFKELDNIYKKTCKNPGVKSHKYSLLGIKEL